MYCSTGEVLPPLPVMSAEDAMLPVSKSITAELREQWAVLNEVWGTPMAQWKGVAVAAWMEAAIGKCIHCLYLYLYEYLHMYVIV